ncbi:MmgE/PrpD family protein [Chloroflexota bacterium]
MASLMETLIRFAVEISFEDLPEEVIHESKLILLDSIGCALGGLSTDKGKIAVELARHLNGAGEATIIGSGDRVSCYGAAFANGELIHALDYESDNHPVGHVVPYVLAAPLALAEHKRASGKEVICAIAIAMETSVRFGKALPGGRAKQSGETAVLPIRGYSWNIFGGTAASGSILGLDMDKVANALGIAGVIAPMSARQKFHTTVPVTMSKHLMAGWVCGAEVITTLLANMGYIGDTSVLEGESGFWRFSGYTQWKPGAITEQLGQTWHFVEGTTYKLYPCCGVPNTALDCLIDIINKNDVQPEDIKRITVYLAPYYCDQPIWQNREIGTQMDAQFSVIYNLSVAAHRVQPGPEWQELDTIHNPSILALMNKISLEPHPEHEKVHQEDATTRLSKVEVVARGRQFSEERKYAKGTRKPEAFKLSDDELVEKFMHQASRVLPAHKVDKAIDSILHLEVKDDISELMNEIVI